jgi:hypothetical protein
MEANPPILDYKFEIVIEYAKRLKDKEIEKRIKQKDSLLEIYKRKYDLEPTRANFANYEMIVTKLHTDKRYLIPFYSDDRFSYFMHDNLPYGYRYLDDSDKAEIDLLIKKIKEE